MSAKDYQQVTTNCPPQTEMNDWQWLIKPPTHRLLARLANEPFDPLRLANYLRKDNSAARARLMIEQIELRHRAAAKFTRAGNMLFTRKGYEQATDEWIAQYKAGRFTAFDECFDLCCGIGGDAIGLAKTCATTAIESCAVTKFCAEHNLAIHAEDAAYVSRAQMNIAESVNLGANLAWHIDPDRRPTGRRTTGVESMQPGRQILLGMLGKCENAAIKLAPATRLEDWPFSMEREWIGRGGECKQQLAWHGRLMQSPDLRRATVLPAGGGPPLRTITGIVSAPRFAPLVGDFVYDVDSTVLAAGLTGTLAAQHKLTAWSSSDAYLTGNRISDPALASFRVLEVLPLRTATVAEWLKQRGMGRLEIKHRIARFDPEKFRKQLRAKGDNHATLLLASQSASQGANRVAVIAERMKPNT